MKTGIALLIILIFSAAIAGYPSSREEVTAAKQILARFESIGRLSSLEAPLLTATRPKAHRMSVIQQKSMPEASPIERHPQLSEDFIVVKGRDARGNEIARTSLLDPRLVRAEVPDSSGKLTTRNFYLECVEFLITLPDDPRILSIEFFQPCWTGTEYLLESLGETRLD